MQVAAPTVRASTGPVAGPITDAVQQVVDRWRVAHHVPAVYASVRRAGAAVADVASGVSNLGTGRSARPTDRLWAASVTKMMTAAMTLRLAERGELSLADRVSTWLPELPEAGRITVRQLLNQTAGIPELWEIPGLEADIRSPDAAQWSERQLLDGIAGLPRTQAPGSRFAYSNSNYTVAGAIIERVTGKPLSQVFEEELATTLNLDAPEARLDDAHGPNPSNVHSYVRTPGAPMDGTPYFGTDSVFRSVLAGAGNLVSTAPALAQLGESILAQDGEALTPKSRADMQRLRRDGHYGLGVYGGPIGTNGGFRGTFVGHNGAFDVGAGAYLVHVTERNETIAVMANTQVDEAEWGELLGAIVDATGPVRPPGAAPKAMSATGA